MDHRDDRRPLGAHPTRTGPALDRRRADDRRDRALALLEASALLGLPPAERAAVLELAATIAAGGVRR